MRWVRTCLPAIAAAMLAGCAATPPAAKWSQAAPSPTLASPTPEASGDPLPSWSPPPVVAPPLDLPSPSPQVVNCGKIRTTNAHVYWQERAIPPATCRQAAAIMPRALSQHPATGDYTVSGWRCQSDNINNTALAYDHIACTSGSRTVDMVLIINLS
jgi:hypothetical protein